MKALLQAFVRLSLATIFLLPHTLQAATVNSNGSGGGNWNSGSSWQGGSIPGSGDNVVIRSGDEIKLTANQTCANLTVTGTLNCNTNNRILTVNGNITFTGTGNIMGNGATREVNVGGTMTVGSGVDAEVSGIVFRVTGNSTITGDLTFTAASGSRTLTGDVTVTGGLYFSANAAVAMGGRLTLNAGGKVGTGGGIGTITVANNLNSTSGATRNIEDVIMSFGTNSSVAGTLTSTDADLSFAGTFTVSGGASYTGTGGSLTVAGTTTSASTLALSGVTATLAGITVNGGATLSATNGTAITASGNTSNASTITLNNSSASLTTLPISGGASVAASNGATLTCSGATTNTGTITLTGSTGNFAAITINSGCNLSATSSAVTATGTMSVNGGTFTLNNATADLNTLQWTNSSMVNAGTGTNVLSLTGNWTNGSSAADPFVEGSTSTVTFKGASGTQAISRTGGTETFDALVIANTSATSPGVRTTANIQVNDDFDHTSGIFDINGKTLTVTGSSTSRTHDLKGGARMISGVSGASFTVTDPNNDNEIDFFDYRVGDSGQSVVMNVTCGRLTFEKFTQWGAAAFTKTKSNDDVFGGGNYYHGPVTFTANSTASRWRMGDGTAQPDTFMNATFNANAAGGSNNNFIVCTNSQGNAFYGTTNMYSTTPGGFFIGRKNGAGASSATFFGPVVARVALTGSIVFADAASGNASSITFQGTVQTLSAASSTGDIYFGNSPFSTVTFSSTGQFIPGALQGFTSIYLRNVTQNGTLAQQITSASNSKVYCGATNMPCAFSGPVTFTADTLDLNTSTFNNTIDASGLSYLTFSNSTFKGATNNFTKAGSSNSDCPGGNTFDTGTTNVFTNSGSGHLHIATTTADDMNGNARYVQSGTGALSPAYNTACTYAGVISTSGTTTAIEFGSNNGTVVMDGAASKVDGSVSLPPVFKRLTTAFSGTALVNIPLTVRTQLTMNSGLLDLNGNTLTLGTAVATPGALTWTGGGVHNGTFKRWFGTAAITIGNGAGMFPTCASNGDVHPLWFGSAVALSTGGTLAVSHSPTTQGTTTTSFTDASWSNTIVGISNSAWTVTAANGLAVNGTNGRVRYGGNGLSPFVLGDLDACQAGAAIGTFASGTSAAVPLEVNRTNLTTAMLGNTWRIGTRNNAGSPLPIELLSFTARPHGEEVLLAWATASEQDNALFTVERSADAEAFSLVLTREGAGNSTQMLHYEATDRSPLEGTSYYRLKQTDTDGTSTWSDIVPVQRRMEEEGLQVYPTPCTLGPITIRMDARMETAMRLTVLDGMGRTVLQRTAQPDAPGRITLDRSELRSAGTYHVMVEGDGLKRHGTIIVE